MRRRRIWLLASAPALVAVAALLVVGARGRAVRTYALEAPNYVTVAVLHPHQRECEGPVVSDGPAVRVGIWGASAAAPARLAVDVSDATTGRVLARGALLATAAQRQWTADLEPAVPGGRPLRVCVTDTANTFSLSGSAPQSNILTTGKVKGAEFSLVLLSNGRGSLLSSLSTAFARASLWHPAWVGSWTFWVLAAGLLATFGLAAAAVVGAAAGEDGDPPRGEPEDAHGPPSPTGDTPERSRSRAYG